MSSIDMTLSILKYWGVFLAGVVVGWGMLAILSANRGVMTKQFYVPEEFVFDSTDECLEKYPDQAVSSLYASSKLEVE